MKKGTPIVLSTLIAVSVFIPSGSQMMTNAKGHSESAHYWDEPGRVLPVLIPSLR